VAPLPLSRRSFLAAAGGLLVTAACGSNGSKSVSAGVRPNGLDAGTVTIDPYVSSAPERFAFAISDDRRRFASGPPARIALEPPGGSMGPPLPTVLHAEGLPERRGIYVIDVPFPTAGVWTAAVQVAGHPDAPLSFEVAAQPAVPAAGAPAPRAASPTAADTLGVDPICTRDPACPLHTVSLDKVLGAGKPVAVMFATPARCQSRYCGPVLDQLLSVRDAYEGRVVMVHVEIYKDSTSQDLVPTVTAWNLPGEPWLFGVDGTGKIIERLDGAMGTDEVKALLDRLVA